jgi:hypothetical protein
VITSAAGLGALRGRAALSPLIRGLGLPSRARPGVARRAWAAHDTIELLDQPRPTLVAARKGRGGRPTVVQPLALQQRPGGGPFAELVERQRPQEICRRRRSTFRKSLQEDQRTLRPLIEQRRRGGQHQNDSITGARLDCLLGNRQKTRMEVCISEGGKQPFRPHVGCNGRVREQVQVMQC